MENGIKNHLVTFGLDLSPSMLTSLIALSPERIIISTRQFAKRQMTWFKKDERVVWFEKSESDSALMHCKQMAAQNE